MRYDVALLRTADLRSVSGLDFCSVPGMLTRLQLGTGFDRLMSILCKTSSIRDVIAFPKTAAGTDLLFKSPSPSTPEVLAQYGLQPQS